MSDEKAVQFPVPWSSAKPKAEEQARSGDVIERIENYRGLEKDWDSYGAPPIQEGAILLALDLVRILEGTEHEIVGSGPTNDEAILLDTKSGRGIEVSIYGN